MRPTSLAASSLALAVSLAATPALAQDPLPPADLDEEILVIAERIRGQVDAEQPPIIELNEEEIAGYGADSLADLVAQLAPQTGSGRGRGGRPVFLINGQRVSGFREFRRYPPEAIRKVEVLPEEVAQKFGYPADQRVINFILKDNFSSREIEVEYGSPTDGGSASGELEGSMLVIQGPRRINLGAEFNTSSMLTEQERGIVQTTGAVTTGPDPARFRSLQADSERLELEGTLNTGIGEGGLGGSFSLNGNFTSEYSRSLSGLDVLATTGFRPLERLSHVTTAALGSSFNKPLGDWQFAATLDASRTRSVNLIDRPTASPGGAGQDRSRSNAYDLASLFTLIGSPILLPAGEVNVTFDAGYSWDRVASTDTRGALGETVLKRGDLSGGVNLGIPLTSRREGFLGGVGDITLNLGAGIDELSDFGTLTDWNAGLNWGLTDRLSLQGSYIYREVAPGLGQLGNPQVVTFNVPVFDFTTGDNVLATITTGGNPNLLAETQRDIKLSASYDLDLFERANIVVEYFRNRSDNVTESFPLLTPAVEAAFPDRVTRVGGTLTAIDRRPVTFAERNSERIRYGFNVFGRVGKARERGGDGPPAAAGGAGGPPGGAFDPARMAEMRAKFCATPEGQAPDISALPEPMQARLRGPDGQIDQERLAQMRARMCSGDGGAGAGGPDPERFAAMRRALCDLPEGQEPDLTVLPEPVLERLRGPDGAIDPAKLAQFRERICAMPAPQAGQGGQGGGGNRGGGGGGGGGPRFGPGGGDGQGRWNLSLYHTVEFNNEALIAAGGPLLDLLDGDALGGGGVPRHKLELEGGVFYKGLGLRVSGNYSGKTRVEGSGLPGSSDLFFGDLLTFDARMFINLEEQQWLSRGHPDFFKGLRMSIRANNLFNQRQRVVDETGTVPLAYQPGLIDPVGRFVEVEFRKIF